MTLGSPGQLIANRYQVLQFLGKGTFGEVWKAVDLHRSHEPSLGPHEVALKLILNKDRGATWHEASILTALRSEHILEVNNADESVDVVYLDTALADCSLDARAVPLGVEPGLAVVWMRRALRGLHLCHQHRLLHRDIKPHNIFLTASGDAKLGDFGTAVLMDQNGEADSHGDPRIRAPELFSGGRASVASDIYSASCSLYALVAGRLPFEAGAQITDIVQGSYTPVRDLAPHVSQALAEKISKGMALNPAKRFENAAVFDSVLALPLRSRRFTPIPTHSAHIRCWTVTGRGQDIRVCALPGARAKSVSVETRYQSSGNRLKDHCIDTTERDLPKRLRKIFNDLR